MLICKGKRNQFGLWTYKYDTQPVRRIAALGDFCAAAFEVSIIVRLRLKLAIFQLTRIQLAFRSDSKHTTFSSLSSNNLLIWTSQLCYLITVRVTIFLFACYFCCVCPHYYLWTVTRFISGIVVEQLDRILLFCLFFMWNLSEKGFVLQKPSCVRALCVWKVSSASSRHRSHQPQQYDVLTFCFLQKKIQ